MSPQFVLDSLHTPLLLNEVINHFRCFLVFQLSFRDATHVKQNFQLWVQVIQIEACVRIPAHMANVLEVAWGPNISLCQFLPLALHLLFLLVKATVHHVVHVGIVVEAHIVYLRVLDVHRRHWQRGSIWWITPFLSFLLSSAEQFI